MIIDGIDLNKVSAKKARKRLVELSKLQEKRIYYVDGSICDENNKLIAENPDDFQKEWVLFRLSHSNTWPKVHENKIGDWKHWI
jgi:hypothetical protein